MHLVHRVWGAILIASHAVRFWGGSGVPPAEISQLRSEIAVAESLLRRTNSALDQCLLHQSFVVEVGRVLSLLGIEVGVLLIFWQIRRWWRSFSNQFVYHPEIPQSDSELEQLPTEPESGGSTSASGLDLERRKGPTTPSSLRRRIEHQ